MTPCTAQVSAGNILVEFKMIFVVEHVGIYFYMAREFENALLESKRLLYVI